MAVTFKSSSNRGGGGNFGGQTWTEDGQAMHMDSGTNAWTFRLWSIAFAGAAGVQNYGSNSVNSTAIAITTSLLAAGNARATIFVSEGAVDTISATSGQNTSIDNGSKNALGWDFDSTQSGEGWAVLNTAVLYGAGAEAFAGGRNVIIVLIANVTADADPDVLTMNGTAMTKLSSTSFGAQRVGIYYTVYGSAANPLFFISD